MPASVDPALIVAWITYAKAKAGSQEYEQCFWSFDKAWELCHEDPELAWRFVLEVLEADSSPQVQGILSAGPLEDLLAKHPYQVIDRVEQEAKAKPRFASLLGGVWQNAMPDDIWARVQAVWDRRGWDGIPDR